MHDQLSLSTVSLSLHELAALLQSEMSVLFVASEDYAHAWVVNVISLFFVRCPLHRQPGCNRKISSAN